MKPLPIVAGLPSVIALPASVTLLAENVIELIFNPDRLLVAVTFGVPNTRSTGNAGLIAPMFQLVALPQLPAAPPAQTYVAGAKRVSSCSRFNRLIRLMTVLPRERNRFLSQRTKLKENIKNLDDNYFHACPLHSLGTQRAQGGKRTFFWTA